MPLILNEQILGDLIRAIQSNANNTLDDATCLEIVAQSFGQADPLTLLSKISDAPLEEPAKAEDLPPVLAFWKSGLLNSFITDYSCRRQPIVAVLSGTDSIIILSSLPSRIFEITQKGQAIHLNDLGSGPWSAMDPIDKLEEFTTPAKAFDKLCQMHHWDWSHSAMNDVA